MKIQKVAASGEAAHRSGRGGQELLFRCRLVGLDRFRRMTRCARGSARFEKSAKSLKLTSFGNSKSLKLLKLLSGLKTSKVKQLPETLLPDHASVRLSPGTA